MNKSVVSPSCSHLFVFCLLNFSAPLWLSWLSWPLFLISCLVVLFVFPLFFNQHTSRQSKWHQALPFFASLRCSLCRRYRGRYNTRAIISCCCVISLSLVSIGAGLRTEMKKNDSFELSVFDDELRGFYEFCLIRIKRWTTCCHFFPRWKSEATVSGPWRRHLALLTSFGVSVAATREGRGRDVLVSLSGSSLVVHGLNAKSLY